MRTFDEAMAASIDTPAFANSTEGSGWTAAWCARCVHDTDDKIERGEGCPLVLVTLMGRLPVEFVEGSRAEDGAYSIRDQWRCVEFRDRGDGGDSEPGPVPVPECGGQVALLSTEAVEGPLVHLPVPEMSEVAR